MAMAFVSMSFAQLIETPVTNVQNPNMDRSDWYGFTSNSSSAFIFDAEAEYLLRIPAGAIPAGTQLTKVLFEHLTSESFGASYTDDPFGAEQYTIKIYTGTTYVPVTYIGSQDGQEHTYDSLNPGTLAYSMIYSPTETGLQTVELTTPFVVPAADFCVSIYCADKSAGGLCPTNDACADQSYAYMDDETGWWHYQFGAVGSSTYYHKPWLLAVYYDDGQPYQPKSDLYAEMYNPNDGATYPNEVQWVEVDRYTDSLYFYGGFFNMGIDSSYGNYYLSLYIDGTTPLYIWEREPLAEEYEGINPMYGSRIGPMGLVGIENWPDLNISIEEAFDLCINITYESAPEYNGVDPNLENNTYCVTYSKENPYVGVQENTNTLTVSPNPASTYINVENAAGSQISVYNIAGQEVMSVEAAEANETLNVSNLNAGLYIVRVVNGNEVSTAKVSIVR